MTGHSVNFTSRLLGQRRPASSSKRWGHHYCILGGLWSHRQWHRSAPMCEHGSTGSLVQDSGERLATIQPVPSPWSVTPTTRWRRHIREYFRNYYESEPRLVLYRPVCIPLYWAILQNMHWQQCFFYWLIYAFFPPDSWGFTIVQNSDENQGPLMRWTVKIEWHFALIWVVQINP
jgi:hypothetical protein